MEWAHWVQQYLLFALLQTESIYESRYVSFGPFGIRIELRFLIMLEVSSQPIQKGLVRFKPHKDWALLLKMTEEKPLSLMVQEERWDMSENRYRVLLNNGTINSIEVLQISSLKIRWGNLVNIIRELSDITFPCLKQLHLNGNAIQSIQALYTLDMRFLTNLNLKQNNITSLRTLPKCHLPNLLELTLFKNKIIDFSPLQRLNAPKLQKIWSTPQKDSFDTNNASCWIFRIQSKRVDNLFIKHERAQIFDFEGVQVMARKCFGRNIKLSYYVQDDINIRRE